MNAFDRNFEQDGLDGIGSFIRKVGRTIDNANKKVHRAHDKLRREVTPEFARNFESKLRDEVVKFLGTDIGKAVIVIIGIVASVVLSPAAYVGLQAAVSSATTAMGAIKSGALYIAKQITLKEVAKELGKQALQYGVEKYMEKRQEKKFKELEARLEKEYEAKLEAEFREKYGVDPRTATNTSVVGKIVVGPIANLNPANFGPDGKPIPPGFTFPAFQLPDDYNASLDRGAGATRMHSAYVDNYRQAKNRYINELKNDVPFLQTIDDLKAQGKTDEQIAKEWVNSKTYKDLTVANTVQNVSPIMKKNFMAEGYPADLADSMAVVAASNLGKEQVKQVRGAKLEPALLIGAALLALQFL